MQPIGHFIDTPDYHDLSYKGRIVRMEVADRGMGNIAIGFNMSWEFYRIYIPKSIWAEKDRILQAIKEAFLVYRYGHRRNKEDITSISAKISCEPECVETDYNGL